MDIVWYFPGKIIVYDDVDMGNIETSRSEVSSNKDIRFISSKFW